eukprot:4479463-Alexandrium_andersonii.AAC.1
MAPPRELLAIDALHDALLERLDEGLETKSRKLSRRRAAAAPAPAPPGPEPRRCQGRPKKQG